MKKIVIWKNWIANVYGVFEIPVCESWAWNINAMNNIRTNDDIADVLVFHTRVACALLESSCALEKHAFRHTLILSACLSRCKYTRINAQERRYMWVIENRVSRGAFLPRDVENGGRRITLTSSGVTAQSRLKSRFIASWSTNTKRWQLCNSTL